jgi:hypothetical protein
MNSICKAQSVADPSSGGIGQQGIFRDAAAMSDNHGIAAESRSHTISKCSSCRTCRDAVELQL